MSGFGSAIKGSLLFTVLGLVFLTPWVLLRYLGSWYMYQWYVKLSGSFFFPTMLYYTLAYVYAVVIYGTLFFMTLNKFFNDSYQFSTSLKSMVLFLIITIIPFIIASTLYTLAGYYEPFTFTWRINPNIPNPTVGYFMQGLLYRALAFLIFAPFFIAGITAGLNSSLFDIGEEYFEEGYDYEY